MLIVLDLLYIVLLGRKVACQVFLPIKIRTSIMDIILFHIWHEISKFVIASESQGQKEPATTE